MELWVKVEPRYNWNIVEIGVKHHKPTKSQIYSLWILITPLVSPSYINMVNRRIDNGIDKWKITKTKCWQILHRTFYGSATRNPLKTGQYSSSPDE